MKLNRLAAAILCGAALSTAGVFAQDAQNKDAAQPKTYDENATAESLGLVPYETPEGLFPIFPWDHLEDWGDKYLPLEEGIQTMAESKCTLSAFVYDERSVEAARKAGLHCIYEMRMNSFDDRNMSEEEIQKKLDEIDAQVKERVQSTKDDPCVLGYYLRDEPGCYFFRSLAAAVAAVKKYAPGKLAYINLYPGYASTIGADADSQLGAYSYREYLERFVQEVKPMMLSYDNYMVEYSDDLVNLERGNSHFQDLFEVRAVSQKYGIPFWFIGSSLCIMEDSAPPTAARFAYQAYTALAAGAQGMTWFLYYPLGWQESPISAEGGKTLSWLYMRDVNIQVNAIGSYLRAYKSTECGMTPLYTKEEAKNLPQFPELPKNVLKNLTYRFSNLAGDYEKDEPKVMVGEFAQKDGDNVAALAVNLNFSRSVRVKFDLPDGYKTVKVVSPVDGSESVLGEASMKNGVWIIPGHGKLFVFEK